MPPVRTPKDKSEEKYRIMSVENKRWHTDRIMYRFGSDVLADRHGASIFTTGRVVLELWKEAKMQRAI